MLLTLGSIAICSSHPRAMDQSPPEQSELATPEDGSAVKNKVDPMAGPALQWEPSTAPQSGIDHYEVWIDGQKVEEVPGKMYTAYPQDYGEHTWRVVAVNGAGLRRKSEESTFTSRTLAVAKDVAAEEKFLNSDPYPSIQAAIDDAGQGDTVLVYPGTYRDVVEVDVQGVTLKEADYSEATTRTSGNPSSRS